MYGSMKLNSSYKLFIKLNCGALQMQVPQEASRKKRCQESFLKQTQSVENYIGKFTTDILGLYECWNLSDWETGLCVYVCVPGSEYLNVYHKTR